MLLVRASVKPSPIHGMGCFAQEPIRKGQVVWVLDKRIDLCLPVSELEAMPQAAQAFMNMYGYVTMLDGVKTVVLCGDHSKHMNHADQPNLAEGGDGCEANIAVRDIAAGEELTCNYHCFDLDACRKLGE